MLRGLVCLLLHFVYVVLLAFPAMLWKRVHPSSRLLGEVVHRWGCAHFANAGARLVVEGVENLERARPAVVIANHASHFDIYAIAKGVRAPVIFAAKASLFRIPFLGWVMRGLGMRPIERSGSSRDMESIAVMTSTLVHGTVLVFFAEGTRSRDGRLGRFKKGGVLAAMREGVPIVPVAIAGSHRVQAAGSWKLQPATVTLTILEPIPTAGTRYEDRDALTERAYAAILAALPPDQRPRSSEEA